MSRAKALRRKEKLLNLTVLRRNKNLAPLRESFLNTEYFI